MQERLVEKLERERVLARPEFMALLQGYGEPCSKAVSERAHLLRDEYYGKEVFVRGLIEFTNCCRKDCYYCGIRASNVKAVRYRLSPDEIYECCGKGYGLGYRTFVLQGGEDPGYKAEEIAALVERIKGTFPDCAVTLSVGEHERSVYQMWHDAGADRYLLRHETADNVHYGYLHPASSSPENRKRCLVNLKEIGYQVGCGFMVGSPGQRAEHLAEDLLFIHALQPEMVGIGPFIPKRGTPFEKEPAGSLERTLLLLGILRIMLPDVLLPATTALGAIHPQGLERGILAGANVCMPNLTPRRVRGQYALYDGKEKAAGEGALEEMPEDGDADARALEDVKRRLEQIGYHVPVSRGDKRRTRLKDQGFPACPAVEADGQHHADGPADGPCAPDTQRRSR